MSEFEFREAAARFSVCQGSRPYSERAVNHTGCRKTATFLYILRFYVTWKFANFQEIQENRNF